jgi:hypothetical protein
MMGMFRQLLRRLHLRCSYANVTATLALFVSLGGASYAAVSLPSNSVGSRQLRARAVTRRTLGFPLGLTSATYVRSDEIPGGTCNGWPLLPGEPAPPCVPRPGGGRAPGRELTVHLGSRGTVLISAVLGVDNRGIPGTRATVAAEVVVDRRAGKEHLVALGGGDSLQLPIQEALTLGPGTHTIGVAYRAKYSARGPDVFVGPTSVVALALPTAGDSAR